MRCFDKAHGDYQILLYAQAMKGRKVTVGEALAFIGQPVGRHINTRG